MLTLWVKTFKFDLVNDLSGQQKLNGTLFGCAPICVQNFKAVLSVVLVPFEHNIFPS